MVSGYYKCQESPKKSLFTFRRGASMLRRDYSPLVLFWRHPCKIALIKKSVVAGGSEYGGGLETSEKANK